MRSQDSLLDEIDEIFASSHNILDPVQVAKRLPRKELSQCMQETNIAAAGTHTPVEHVEFPMDEKPHAK